MDNTTASSAPRPACPKCVLKHLSQACVLFQESLQGYPAHRWLAIGHMAEAEAEAQETSSAFADLLREERKKAENVNDLATGYVPDCMKLINHFAGVSPEAKVAFDFGDCPTCDKLKGFKKAKEASRKASIEDLIGEILTIAKEL